MPIAKVQLPDGRIAKFEVPDGTTPQEIEAFAARQFMVVPDASKQIAGDSITKGAKDNLSPLKSAAGDLNSALKFVNPASYINAVSGSMNDRVDKAAYDVGGKVTDSLAGVVSPETAAGAGYLANLATQQIPTMIGGGVGKLAGQGAGRSLMQSAIKPTTADLQSGKAARAINTLLETGTSPTVSGLSALKSQADDLANQMSGILSRSPATVSRQAAAAPVQQVLSSASKQAAPGADMKAINGVLDEFMSIGHPALGVTQNIPVDLANKLKQGIYKAVGDRAYGQVASAQTEAEKAIARGLRQEVGKAVPEVESLLAKQSDLYNAVNVAKRYALLSGNNNPMGLAPLANNPAAAAMFLADRNPWVRGLLARGAYSGGMPVGAGVGALAGAYSGAPD